MSKIVRTYLIAYGGPGNSGRFVHYRYDDTAPTFEQIESMEAKLAADHGCRIAITSLTLIENSEPGPSEAQKPFTVQLPTFEDYPESMERELQAAFTQAIEAAGGQVKP